MLIFKLHSATGGEYRGDSQSARGSSRSIPLPGRRSSASPTPLRGNPYGDYLLAMMRDAHYPVAAPSPVKVAPTPLPGVVIIEPRVFEDGRGFFNHSRSVPETVRRLYYQLRPRWEDSLDRCVTEICP